MESSLLTILPNLSIGVIAVLSMVYVVRAFLAAQEDQRKEYMSMMTTMRSQHEEAMTERESAFRAVEKEMRESLTKQLHQNTNALERVINHLDGKH